MLNVIVTNAVSGYKPTLSSTESYVERKGPVSWGILNHKEAGMLRGFLQTCPRDKLFALFG